MKNIILIISLFSTLTLKERFIEELKPDQAIHLILISASEVHRNDYSDEFQKIIHADALFL